MTWGEIQIESLKKMFLNKEELTVKELDEYKTDKKYKTYLFAMPQAANEAISKIINVSDRPIVNQYTIEKKDGNTFVLNDELSDFKTIKEIIPDNGEIIYKIINNDTIVITNWGSAESFDLYYEAFPKLISLSTKNDYKIPLNNQQTILIPLYIAGELYKDDDIQISTIYMNEFESGLSLIANTENNIPTQIKTIYEMW